MYSTTGALGDLQGYLDYGDGFMTKYGTTFFTLTGDPLPVPEPATWAMMALGFRGVGFIMRTRRKGAVATA